MQAWDFRFSRQFYLLVDTVLKPEPTGEYNGAESVN